MTSRERIIEIFKTNNHLLRIYAERIVVDKEEAKDMVNDVFLKLMENENNTHITKSLQAYLYKSVYNTCLNCLKNKQITNKYFQDMDTSTLDIQCSKNPLSLLISEETLTHIENAIESLPPKCKKVFLLAKMDGLSYREIAEQLKISVNSVNKQITKALNILRESLEKKDVSKL